MTTRQTPDAVREAILKYTQHHVGCAVYGTWVHGEPKCSCGLDDARASLTALDSDPGEVREWPDIGDDPMQHRPYKDRMAVSADAIRKAYTVQQPIVPDQTALVWRWHLGALLEAEIRLRSILADETATPAPAVDAVPAGEVYGAADMLAFLRGEASLDGHWFGDDHPQGRFWWRAHLAALSHGEGRK